MLKGKRQCLPSITATRGKRAFLFKNLVSQFKLSRNPLKIQAPRLLLDRSRKGVEACVFLKVP